MGKSLSQKRASSNKSQKTSPTKKANLKQKRASSNKSQKTSPTKKANLKQSKKKHKESQKRDLNRSRRKQVEPKRRTHFHDFISFGRKFKISSKTMREIKNLQRSTNFVIPKLPFARVVREICMGCGPEDLRIHLEALEALHTAAEVYMVDFFEDANLCAAHAKRLTIFNTDMHLVQKLRGENLVLREVCMEYGSDNLRKQLQALEALQTAAEVYMVDFFGDANLCASHAKRLTIYNTDMHLVKQLHKESL